MDQYPDEDELFDVRCQELEVIGDISQRLPGPDSNMIDIYSNSCEYVIESDSQPHTSKRIASVQAFPSPEISQITNHDDTADGMSCHGRPVHRRLFDVQRGSSTPFTCQKVAIDLEDTESSRAEASPFAAIMEDLQNVGRRGKRSLERDLFGDIDDINIECSYVDPVAKKARSEEQRDMDMITQILDTRKKMRESTKNKRDDSLTRLNMLHAFKMQNLSYTQPRWPSLKLTQTDNETVYVRFHSDEYENRAIADVNVFSKGYSGLLGESKQRIWTDANEIILKNTSVEKSPPLASAHVDGMAHQTSEVLWVEKYKPKKYKDLLSDESTNRNLLYWLKMWDKVVFGCLPKMIETSVKSTEVNSFNKKSGRFESNGGWSRRKRRQDLNTNVDDFGRPVQKIALLCGPPGLGKTTLAHIIAKHAGYQVREVNASDDRNPDVFMRTLQNGTQMKSVLNTENRPNCIILDEIDGAPKQSIELLIKFATDNLVTKAKTKAAKSKKNILKRPIICICNDLYEPALRQLRQVAFVVTFPPIESVRLAERLGHIARKETLRTDFGTLITLAEKSGNDVRSCISTMQFFNAQKKALTLRDVLNSSIGEKDRRQGLFDVWGAVFRIKRPEKRLDKSAFEGESQVTMTDMSVETRVRNVLQVVQNVGDYERLTQGVYENYLQQKMPDPNLNGVVEGSNWFCFSDTVQHQIALCQNYSVYPYLQLGFVVWHLLFASLAWPKISFPSRGFEFHQQNATHKSIFQAFRKGISSAAVSVGEGHVVLLETVPLLKRILSPQLRSVAVQLLSPREQNDLRHTVDIMADLGLTYTQVSKGEGQYTFQMEPDLEALSNFPGCPEMSLNYCGRQLIAREVELEQMRRAMPINKAHSQRPPSEVAAGHRPRTAQLQTLKPKAIPKKENTKNTPDAVSKDFFGRLQRKKATAFAEGSDADPIVKSPIWYHYKEGFNNAVRKDVQLKELL